MLYHKNNNIKKVRNMNMYNSETYEPREDIEFQKAIDNGLSEDSVETYRTSVKMFCEINNKTYEEIVLEIREEQYDRIDGDKIIRYDPNQGNVSLYCNNLIDHYRKKGSSNQTIQTRLTHIRSMLKKSGIILPQKPKLPKTNAKPVIITRANIKTILNRCSVSKKSQITFLASTGMRVHDLIDLDVDSFIEATKDYHNFVDVDEFIDNAPQDMMGFWVFEPNKTKRLGLECRVCNSPESSNYILENLRRRKFHLSKKGLKINGEDPLFVSEKTGFKKKLHRKSITYGFWNLNQEFQKDLKTQLDELLRNKQITRKEYKKRLECMPKLHPHGLRKFFTTTVRNYTTNRDISLIMEGHTSPYKMDKHYVGSNDELFSDEIIKETYRKIIPYLTFNYEVDPKEYEKLKKIESEYQNQLKKNEELEDKIDKIVVNLKQLEAINNAITEKSVLDNILEK